MAELKCCKTMKQQLTDRCEQHHKNCPDNVITVGQNSGKLYLSAENADYAFAFCPWCGKAVPKELQA